MLKALDIAFKDLVSALRNATALIFMFGIPLLMTGMFYFMLGRIATQGEFDLPRTRVVVANLDRDGAPRLSAGSKDIPGGIQARTLSGLVVEVLRSDDMTDLLEVQLVADAASARQAVDAQQAHVAVIIPAGFSRDFADLYSQATIEFYQDPTLTLAPGVVRSILNQFMDGLSGAKIAVDVALEQTQAVDYAMAGRVVQEYLEASPMQSEHLADDLLDERSPSGAQQSANPLLRMIAPIMGGMMIFYAFYTGASIAESILREEERRTLQRLFTTPTPQVAILTGKFMSVFLTVLVQMLVLLIAARLIFGIDWGRASSVAVNTVGMVLIASSTGIFINSLLKDTRQGAMIFGGVLTVTGMLGMISVFGMSTPITARLGNTIALLVPQGWAVRGLMQAMNDQPITDVLATTLVMLCWSAVLFAVGAWRFNRRYA
ncbi:MAG: ABC transporter permease [Anaerolineales bacterium]|nr:ABC transporter permease [Anaerolineales bacterium]